MSGPAIVIPARTPTAPELRLWVPGMQAAGSGAPVDRSANAFAGTLGSALTDANLWLNPGYMTTVDANAGSNGGVQFPSGVFNWDASTNDSFLISMIFRRGSLPSTEKAIMGNLSGAGSAGLQVRLGTGGDLKLGMSDGTKTATFASVSGNLCDGTDKPVQIFWDSDFRKLGARADQGYKYLTDAYTVTGSTISANPFGIGHSGLVATNGTGFFRCSQLQVYVFKGQGLPAHWRRGVERLRANPYRPINDWSSL